MIASSQGWRNYGREVGRTSSIAYLDDLARFGGHLGLERITALLERLGNPHQCYPSVHVAGTNGKGSTCAFLCAALSRAGYRVGMTTSPHLVSFTERIMVAEHDRLQPITEAALDELAERVRVESEEVSLGPWGHVTQFEVSTALAFAHFADEAVDITVVEVGLGGRLDATNVLTPLISVITPISLDHTDVLGADLASIAAEKAGIIKPGVHVVVAPQQPEALEVIEKRAATLGCPLSIVTTGKAQSDLTGSTFTWMGDATTYEDLGIGLLGPHQVANAATAVAALEVLRGQGWNLLESTIRTGLAEAQWPARLQKLSERPLVLLDGAHNPDGARSLAAALGQLVKDRRIIFVVGMLEEKPARFLLETVLPIGSTVVCTQSRQGRTAPAAPQELARIASQVMGPGSEVLMEPDATQAVRRAIALAGPSDVVCIWGSLYLAGEILSAGDLWGS